MRQLFTFFLSLSIVLFPKYSQVRVYTTNYNAVKDMDIVRTKRDVFFEIIANDNDLSKLDKRGLKFEVIIPDLESYYSSKMSGKGTFGNYYTYSEAIAILDSLHNAHPDISTSLFSIGTSWDGNDMWVMKISDNPNLDEDEPEVFADGVIHAREPIGANIIVETVRRILDGYGNDPTITYLVNNREMYFMPVFNPDGYLYNESTNPNGGGMWRKNRRNNGGGIYGVDLNRNFSYEWGVGNVSSDPSSNVYMGPDSFSEPETQHFRAFVDSHNIYVYLNIHSYSDAILVPWSWDPNGHWAPAPDSEIFYEMGTHMQAFNNYDLGTTVQTIGYNCGGTATDWMYGQQLEKPKVYAFVTEVGESFWQESAISRQLGEMVPAVLFLEKTAGVFVEPGELVIDDTLGNGNGKFEAGEAGNLNFNISNLGFKDTAENVIIRLTTDDPFIYLHSAIEGFSSILPYDSVQCSFPVSIDSSIPDGHLINILRTIYLSGIEVYMDTIKIAVGNEVALFYDDFEEGPSQWNWDSPWAITTEDYHSPDHSATDSPGGSYSNYTDASITTVNSISIPNWDNISLSFYHKYQIETGWDYGYCLVFNGTEWDTLDSFTGTNNVWRKKSYSLNSYCGESIKLKFRFYSDVSVTYDGWHIDDVLVSGFQPVGDSIPSTPTLVSPVNDTVYTIYPELTVNNSIDPDNDTLFYGFRVYSDSLQTNIVTKIYSVPEGSSTTSWQVSVPLTEGMYYWRAYASDGIERSRLSNTGMFYVNTAGIAERKAVFSITRGLIQRSIYISTDKMNNYEFSLYDIAGRKVLDYRLKGSHYIDLKNVGLGKGNYFFIIKSGQQKIKGKLVYIGG